MKISLPVDSYLELIPKLLQQNLNLIVSAEPGSGKTTRIPPYLLKHFTKKILTLEPRRVAAISAASRICEENQLQLGEQVGYQVRYDQKFSDKTRLLFLTEALLIRKMLIDPELNDVDLVILDEFHERSAYVDLAIGLIRELQLMGRNIKLIIMSATLNSERIQEFLGDAQILEIPGNLYPLTTHYHPQSQLLRINSDFFERIELKIKDVLPKSHRGILVFLPGKYEITHVHTRIDHLAKQYSYQIFELHGSLTLADQEEIVKNNIERKIILSTNLAESALTLNGIDTVIDCGLEKSVSFNIATETERMQIQRISKASSTQRAGRSARQYPGHVYTLWTKAEELGFAPNPVPEIKQIDLSSFLLYLAKLGVRNFKQFLWYEAPPHSHLNWALNELTSIGALIANLESKNIISIESHFEITPIGHQIIEFPIPPRWALFLVKSGRHFDEACLWVSLALELQNVNINFSFYDISPKVTSDLESLALLFKSKHPKELELFFKRVSRLYHQLNSFKISSINNLNLLQQNSKSELATGDDNQVLKLMLLSCFKSKLCFRKNSETKSLRYDGRGILLSKNSLASNSPFFIPINQFDTPGKSDTITEVAVGYTESEVLSLLKNETSEKEHFEFNSTNLTLRKFKGLYLGQILISPLKEYPITDLDWNQQLFEFFWKIHDHQYATNLDYQHWWKRWKYFQEFYSKQKEIPVFDFNEDIIRSICATFTQKTKKINELLQLDWVKIFEANLPHEIRNFFSTSWPLFVNLPSKKKCPVYYSLGREPYIEARIKDLLGLKSHPLLFDKKLNLIIHVLGPHHRPVQITNNILNFWMGSYHEVRKDLRSRYPKHPWPDDPMQYEAK